MAATRFFPALFLLLFLSLHPAEALDPVLNEFQADNAGTLADEDGENTDWIEIRNPNATPVALDGWALTDDPLLPQRWTFPAGTTLAANSYLVVFASGKDRNDPAGELHTNFKLSAAGEYLALARPDGTVAREFTPTFPAQYADVSYGQANDGATAAYLPVPTPGAANGDGVAGFVEDTKFDPDRGFFDAAFDVTITSATPGATIVYTTDASTPTPTNGTQVPAPSPDETPVAVVHVTQTTTLRAAAFLNGWQPTNTDTHSYILLGDVIRQSPNGETPGLWPTESVNGQVFDYGMDPNVVDDPTWGPQMIDALQQIPTISIVTDQPNLTDPATGIYVNARHDGEDWERPASVELLNPDATPGFQINGGLRIRGGFSRGDFNPKHSFRLFFRSDYGPSKLHYPLFGDEGADEFDKIDLRTAQNYAWSNDTGNNELHNTFIRDVFHRDTQRDMGDPYTRSRYYHLYLNGQYWGLYQTQERSESAYGNTYFGGTRENWDVVKPISYSMQAVDGNMDAYNDLHSQAAAGFSSDAAYYGVQGKNPDGTDNPGLTRQLDIDNLIDYMITNIYCGNRDGPLALSGGVPNNFYVIRNRDAAARDTWKFLCHDSEHSMAASDHNINVDVTGNTSTGTQASHFNPRWLSQQLAQNPNYRRRFGDRVQKFFFNGGAMTTENVLERWNARAAEMDLAIIAESARWGDQHNEPPLDKQTWETEMDWMRNTFLANRGAVVLGQLRTAGLFPNTEAPAFSQHGGTVPGGTAIAISAPAGTIYYTTDGSDPRPSGTETRTTLLATGAAATALVPAAPVNDGWKGGAEPFDDSAWLAGTTGVGYEAGNGYGSFIGLDVLAMRNTNGSVFVRVPFDVTDPGAFDGLVLRMRYDDGFVAYLNGVEIANRNAPAAPAWNSTTLNGALHEASSAFEEINVTAHLGSLAAGTNILAIHGLNANLGSSDMLADPELVGVQSGTGDTTAILYTGPVTLAEHTTLRTAALDGGEWSALTEATFLVDTVPAAAGNLVVSELNYRPALPSAAEDPAGTLSRSDFEFLELHNIGASTIDLTGVHFTSGIEFAFAPDTVLEAGGRLLLVKNTAAFEARYGTGLPVGGEFGGRLSNDGEQIILLDAQDGEILNFTYNDQPPWPTAADGDGMTLVLVDPSGNTDDPFTWRSSVAANGTPGGSDGTVFTGGVGEDADHDGLCALAEYAYGSSDNNASDSQPPFGEMETLDLGSGPEEVFTIVYQRNLAADDVEIEVQFSRDLADWQSGPGKVKFVRATHNGDGTETVVYRATAPASTESRQFLRLVLKLDSP